MFRRGAEEDLKDRPTRRILLPTTLLLQVHPGLEKQLLLPIPRTLTMILATFEDGEDEDDVVVQKNHCNFRL